MNLHVIVRDLSDEAGAYLESCARIRRVSCSRLLLRLLKVICEEQLVLSILDDDSRADPQSPGEATRSKFHKARLYDNLIAAISRPASP